MNIFEDDVSSTFRDKMRKGRLLSRAGKEVMLKTISQACFFCLWTLKVMHINFKVL